MTGVESMNEQMRRAFNALYKSPRCHVCCQVLEGTVLYAADCYWCFNHFTCARCNASLQSCNHITLNTKAYCQPCFDRVRPACRGCGGTLDNGQRYFLFAKAYWHDCCFTCSSCGNAVDNATFVWLTNKISCKKCAGQG